MTDKQYVARDNAFKKFMQNVADQGNTENLRTAFNAGWRGRKEQEYNAAFLTRERFKAAFMPLKGVEKK
jgi:hypothetical protein